MSCLRSYPLLSIASHLSHQLGLLATHNGQFASSPLFIYLPALSSILQPRCSSLYCQGIGRVFGQRLLDNISPLFVVAGGPWSGRTTPATIAGWLSACYCWFLCTSLNSLCWPLVNVWYIRQIQWSRGGIILKIEIGEQWFRLQKLFTNFGNPSLPSPSSNLHPFGSDFMGAAHCWIGSGLWEAIKYILSAFNLLAFRQSTP